MKVSLGAFIEKNKLVILMAEVVVLIGLLLPPSLFHSFSCVSTPAFRASYQSSNGFFIDNQVIVIGIRSDIDKAVNAVEDHLNISLGLAEDCDLSYLNSRGFKWFGKIPIPTRVGQLANTPYLRSTLVMNQSNSFAMRLYEIPKDISTVKDIIEQIDAYSKEENLVVFADPNYLTRLSDSSSDPCIRQGDAGGGGGHPFGNPGMPFYDEFERSYNAAAASDAFMNQWAFGSQGINLPTPMWLKGRWVNVGVFDTSPFNFNDYVYRGMVYGLPSPFSIKTRDALDKTIISNHGLFVVGLIHRIAPRSRIQLIQVLDNYGCGDLWALNKALEDYTSHMSAWTTRLDKTVINLSLGIRTPDEENEEAKEKLETLKSTLADAYRLGAIIIAAAGNDFTDMEIPAQYDHVIGVAATNMYGERACYSNTGNVAAPGGDGGPVTETQPDGREKVNPCRPRTGDWDTGLEPTCSVDDIRNCKYGLISLAQTRYGQQYIFWSGTSFSTPLVSGLAALSFEKIGAHPERVECLIYRKPPPLQPDDLANDLGAGIINIDESLTNNSLLSTCMSIP